MRNVAYFGFFWRGLTMKDIVIEGKSKLTVTINGNALVFDPAECDLVTAVFASFTKRQRTGPVACRSDRKPWPNVDGYEEFIRGFARAALATKKINTASIGPLELRGAGLAHALRNGALPETAVRQEAPRRVLARLGAAAVNEEAVLNGPHIEPTEQQ